MAICEDRANFGSAAGGSVAGAHCRQQCLGLFRRGRKFQHFSHQHTIECGTQWLNGAGDAPTVL
jgi:hypothetical protein